MIVANGFGLKMAGRSGPGAVSRSARVRRTVATHEEDTNEEATGEATHSRAGDIIVTEPAS